MRLQRSAALIARERWRDCSERNESWLHGSGEAKQQFMLSCKDVLQDTFDSDHLTILIHTSEVKCPCTIHLCRIAWSS